ncbi:Asp/Glu-specific dipeptidyl-peptidase [bioreactor metagenome]|uniref:Asp/Glu-specific dipeptidyl-peptidase n=1 Tax=bioreactor metagenome TaxID=1076179 RepID=A0A645CFI1_9ZZZZ
MAAKTHDQKLESLKSLFADYFKDYYNVIDKKTFIALMNEYNKNISDNFKPEYYLELLEIYKSTEALADYLFDTSVFTDESKALTTLNSENFEVLLSSDPFTKLFKAFAESNAKKIKPFLDKKNGEIAILYRTYMKGLLEFDKMRSFYPDANSTLRITYGKVRGYSPRDAVDYKYYTTLDGIMEKDNPDIYDYNIPQKLRDLYNAKDYGIWAVNGTIPVCFVATNHTSGGNSGSPVIDSNGYLVGLNFDRAWEGTMSDIEFDPKVCRNITLDIRYVLFILDKLAGADNILKEIKIVR